MGMANKKWAYIIFGCTFLLICAIVGLAFYKYIRYQYTNNPDYQIVAIVQQCGNAEPLKTAYFAELFNLSVDKPTNLYRFNLKDARKKLLALSMIKEAVVKRIRPGTLFIDYTLREPIAYLTDFTNTVVDREGHSFPLRPFFTPKSLPEIYIGIAQAPENSKMRLDLAFSVLDEIKSSQCLPYSFLKRIDVSAACAASYGQRQIIVLVEDKVEEKEGDRIKLKHLSQILRLDSENFKQGLAKYALLRKHLLKNKEMIVDLRLPKLAIVKGEG